MEIFANKLPGESIVLTFNFAPDLGSLKLSGSPTIAVTVAAGVDPDPDAILNGSPQIDGTQTQWLVPVTGGLGGVFYTLNIIAPTTSPETVLEIQAMLPVGY